LGNRRKGKDKGKIKNKAKKSRVRDKHPKDRPREISFNFSHLDISQGAPLTEWENRGLFTRVVERMKHFGGLKLAQAQDEGLVKYGVINTHSGFPQNSRFRRNNFIEQKVPKDAIWCKFNIGGLPRIVGHMLNDSIYIVFFDLNHDFWPSQN